MADEEKEKDENAAEVAEDAAKELTDAEAPAEEAPAEGAEAAPPKKSKKLFIIIIAAVLVLVLAGVGAMFFLGGEEPAAVVPTGDAKAGEQAVEGEEGDAAGQVNKVDKVVLPSGKAVYLSIKPAFIVNFSGPEGNSHFLQIEIAIMARDSKVIDNVKNHIPYIRNNLVTLFSSQADHDLGSAAAKNQLRKEALKGVQSAMIDLTGEPGVEAVLFTNFVIQ